MNANADVKDTLPPTPMPNSNPPPANTTWPMVAYALVRETPYLAMTLGGAVVSVVLILHGGASSIEELGAVVVPAVISALSRSKPVEPTVGVFALMLGLASKKFGV